MVLKHCSRTIGQAVGTLVRAAGNLAGSARSGSAGASALFTSLAGLKALCNQQRC
jgi:hypothetical protein